VAVSVTVYYKGGPERKLELSNTLSRIHRRAAALSPGRKLTAVKERIKKVQERIGDMDTKEADDAMRAKFHQDMRALTRSCSAAMHAAVSVEYREPDATTPGSLVWLFRGEKPAISLVSSFMESAGMQAVDSYVMGAVASRHDFVMEDLDAIGCNRIRLATEDAARALREEYDGEKASDQIGGCVHADEQQVLVADGVNHYGVIHAAARAVAGFRSAREGRGCASRCAVGLCVGSGEWLTSDAETTLWIRETMKWINREGSTDRDELEAEIGARVGNEPSKDAALFDQAVRAIVGAARGRFDGESLAPMKIKKRKKEG